MKQNIGEKLYKELSQKNKSLNHSETKNIHNKNRSYKKNINNQSLKDQFARSPNFNENISESEYSPLESFLEISPLDYQIESSSRRELSSISIKQIDFPKIVYMIVDKNIELEIKFLKDYPEWDFLPSSDLNRKTIEIYEDIKIAKRSCKKEQKVIKVPNTDIFKIAAPILISRGITRIINSDQLIAL